MRFPLENVEQVKMRTSEATKTAFRLKQEKLALNVLLLLFKAPAMACDLICRDMRIPGIDTGSVQVLTG